MQTNPIEKLDRFEIGPDAIVAFAVEFESLLGIIGVYDATTLTRFFTNSDQSMIDFKLNPKYMHRGTRLITDGKVIDGVVTQAGYVADINYIPDGIKDSEVSENATHQIMVWVSKDFLPHKKVKEIVKENIVNSAGKIRFEPHIGRESRV